MPKKEECCDWHAHKQKVGLMLFLLGLLMLANSYWNFVTWDIFVGGLLVLGGIVKLLTPTKK